MARVLVVNDDGIDAPGLHAIVAALAQDGCSVYVVAPTTERSATGHGISIHAPLVAVPVRLAHATEAYACAGLHADCTMLALGPLFAHVPGGFECGAARQRTLLCASLSGSHGPLQTGRQRHQPR